ncbi:unnamed protein product [Lactuca virosa]|uniref:Sulfite exporter TauE/SafE family protein n=1 Tax=Lactuca virosa TaxID=75947 RepID=A0AAU9LSS5_9ASTR|nr:unnamed protein product [Lactuca virosa]
MCSSSDDRIWPELELNWRIVMTTIIGFLGSAFGTVGSFGGGGIFVPMLTLIVRFDTKYVVALSKLVLNFGFDKVRGRRTDKLASCYNSPAILTWFSVTSSTSSLSAYWW